MKHAAIAAALLLWAATPARALDDADMQEYESMPWEMSAEEQAALKERAAGGDASAANCAAWNSNFPMKDSAIEQCMAANRDALQAVYLAFLQTHPGTRGSITLNLQVNPVGRVVSSALIGMPTLPMDLAESLRVRTALIMFPTSSAGWRGQQRLDFAPP